MTKTNADKFREAYIESLTEFVKTAPAHYNYDVNYIPTIVDRMIAAIKDGGFFNGSAMKQAAKKCGIKTTQKAIREYVLADPKLVEMIESPDLRRERLRNEGAN